MDIVFLRLVAKLNQIFTIRATIRKEMAWLNPQIFHFALVKHFHHILYQ